MAAMDAEGGAAAGGGSGAAAVVVATPSWIEFDPAKHGFGLQNIPWGAAVRRDSGKQVCVTRIGDTVCAKDAVQRGLA